ncbi:DUF2642 domain-containing protein [Vibrio parahaemolyticus]|nr:DUF2642 domain-containing protein [Vibrio parahaemolyticus]ELA9428950.1 DUF2642 domain-containing protein [Vibrio parahaemolyticus]HCG8422758.1 DUF2642 domain-containing protein [Vibrio parahaemolyticus]
MNSYRCILKDIKPDFIALEASFSRALIRSQHIDIL